MTRALYSEARLADHVDRLAEEHPPIDLSSVDYSVRRPQELERRFGHVLDYLARVELEVDRNVLELTTLLPDPPAIDRRFYAEVWQPGTPDNVSPAAPGRRSRRCRRRSARVGRTAASRG